MNSPYGYIIGNQFNLNVYSTPSTWNGAKRALARVHQKHADFNAHVYTVAGWVDVLRMHV